MQIDKKTCAKAILNEPTQILAIIKMINFALQTAAILSTYDCQSRYMLWHIIKRTVFYCNMNAGLRVNKHTRTNKHSRSNKRGFKFQVKTFEINPWQQSVALQRHRLQTTP